MQCSIASLTLRGFSPYSQSRNHSEAKLDGEQHDDYDERTWRSKLHVGPAGTVVIPAHGMHQAICAAAKYSGRQIPGQGKKTWTAKFKSGIALLDDPDTGIDPADAVKHAIWSHSSGVRGSGSRVIRRFPVLDPWTASFEVYILDPIITEPVFREMVTIAGMFIGIGRFRPENEGGNGRFKIDSLTWEDNRQLAA